jgi:hypothetical protein
MRERKKKLVYYAHPIELFGTDVEAEDVEALEALGLRVFNPADHQKEYEEQGGMAYCRKMVSKCDAVAFRRINPQTRKEWTTKGIAKRMYGKMPIDIGAGVYGEIEIAVMEDKPVIELNWWSDLIFRKLDITQTRQHLRDIGWYDYAVKRDSMAVVIKKANPKPLKVKKLKIKEFCTFKKSRKKLYKKPCPWPAGQCTCGT